MSKEIKDRMPDNVKFVLEEINSNILRNYITNLQEENERLEKEYKSKVDDIGKLTSRIYKAIEYYKTHQQECVIGRNKDDRLIRDYYLPAQCSKILLNILQNGSDKE